MFAAAAAAALLVPVCARNVYSQAAGGLSVAACFASCKLMRSGGTSFLAAKPLGTSSAYGFVVCRSWAGLLYGVRCCAGCCSRFLMAPAIMNVSV